MKIGILSQYYAPESAMLIRGLASAIQQQGHKVKVLTSFPNFPKGELYDGYRMSWSMREEIDGVPIKRVPMYIYRGSSGVGRFLNYSTFAMRSMLERSYLKDCDVIYVYATQLTAGFAPWLWQWYGKIPFVLHVQDMWPESVVDSSFVKSNVAKNIISGTLNPWIRSMYRKADGVIGISQLMRQMLIERGAPKDKTYAVYNWGPEEMEASRKDKTPIDMFHAENPNGISFMYAGNMGAMQDLETVLGAAKQVQQDRRFHLFMIGDGVRLEALQQYVKENELSNVTFLPRMPREEVSQLYQSASYQLVTLKDLNIFRATVPSKFQAALYYGAPVVTSVAGEVSELVTEHKVGFTAQPESAGALAAAFKSALELSPNEREQMSQRARAVYDGLMSYRENTNEIVRILQKAAKGGTRK